MKMANDEMKKDNKSTRTLNVIVGVVSAMLAVVIIQVVVTQYGNQKLVQDNIALITEIRANRETTRAASQKTADDIFDFIRLAIREDVSYVSLGADGRVRYVNKRCREEYDLRMGGTLDPILPLGTEKREQHTEMIVRAIESGKITSQMLIGDVQESDAVSHCTFPVVRKDGTIEQTSVKMWISKGRGILAVLEPSTAPTP